MLTLASILNLNSSSPLASVHPNYQTHCIIPKYCGARWQLIGSFLRYSLIVCFGLIYPLNIDDVKVKSAWEQWEATHLTELKKNRKKRKTHFGFFFQPGRFTLHPGVTFCKLPSHPPADTHPPRTVVGCGCVWMVSNSRRAGAIMETQRAEISAFICAAFSGAFWLWSAPHTWLLAGWPPSSHISAASFWS